MENKKAVEKRFKITIVALSFTLLAIIGAIIGVWAASMQGLKAIFSINYSVGENIACAIRTEYYMPGADENDDGVEDGVFTVTKDRSGNVVTDNYGYVTYNTDEESTTKSVWIGDFSLSAKTPKVIFYFTVQSLMDENFIRVLMAPQYTTKNNISVDFTYYNTDSFAFGMSANDIAEDDWNKEHYHNVAKEGFKMIKAEVSIDDLNSPASCNGSFNLELDYSSVDGLEVLDTATVMSAYNGEETIEFKYVKETPEEVATLADETEPKIWTSSDGTTFTVYSKYTIDLPADCSGLFSWKGALTEIDFTNLNTSNVTNMSSMFAGCSSLKQLDFSNFDTSNVTNMSNMFGESGLKIFDLTSFNTSNVTDMTGMFAFTYATSINVSSFDTSNVTNMGSMFFYCSMQSLDVSNFDTSKVTNMGGLFDNCSNLTSLDLSNFDTSKVKYMTNMFNSCIKLTSLDLSNFDTSNVTDMSQMFYNCSKLTSLDLSNSDTAKVTGMSSMFDGCRALISLDLSSFDTSNVTEMSSMFGSCSLLQTIYVSESWSTEKVTGSSYMFFNCTSLVGKISFDSNITDVTYANYTDGYLTYKAKA